MTRRLHGLDEESQSLREIRAKVIRLPAIASERSFAQWFVEHLEQDGYIASTVPELDQLDAGADYVLVRADGYNFHAIAIFDRDRRPGAAITLSAGVLAKIAYSCRQYTGSMNNWRLPPTIDIFEIGEGVITSKNVKRLKDLASGLFSEAWVRTSLMDTRTKRAWLDLGWVGVLLKRELEKLLRQRPAHSNAATAESALATSGMVQYRDARAGVIPFVSLALGVFALAVYFSEVGSSASAWYSGIPPAALYELGGIARDAIFSQHQFWRLLTAPLLHTSFTHLLSNLSGLLIMGWALERVVGQLWFTTIFALGALGGAIASALFVGPGFVSVGASGGILALSICAFIVFWRPINNDAGARLFAASIFSLLPALLPLGALFGRGPAIDFAAHIGGLLVGAALGILILLTWPDTSARPRTFGVLSAAGVIVLGAAVVLLAMRVWGN